MILMRLSTLRLGRFRCAILARSASPQRPGLPIPLRRPLGPPPGSLTARLRRRESPRSFSASLCSGRLRVAPSARVLSPQTCVWLPHPLSLPAARPAPRRAPPRPPPRRRRAGLPGRPRPPAASAPAAHPSLAPRIVVPVPRPPLVGAAPKPGHPDRIGLLAGHRLRGPARRRARTRPRSVSGARLACSDRRRILFPTHRKAARAPASPRLTHCQTDPPTRSRATTRLSWDQRTPSPSPACRLATAAPASPSAPGRASAPRPSPPPPAPRPRHRASSTGPAPRARLLRSASPPPSLPLSHHTRF